MNLALFDFDGILTKADTFGAFLRYAAPRKKHFFGRKLLGFCVLAHRLWLFPASWLRQVAFWVVFYHCPYEMVRRKGREFAKEAIPYVLRKEIVQRMQWHLDRGDRVVVASASLNLYLEHWCEKHSVELICTEVEVGSRGLTGHYKNGDCCGREKAKRIKQHCDLSSFDRIYAYGDRKKDKPMLALADRKYYRGEQI